MAPASASCRGSGSGATVSCGCGSGPSGLNAPGLLGAKPSQLTPVLLLGCWERSPPSSHLSRTWVVGSEALPAHTCPSPQGRRLLRQPEPEGRQRGQQWAAAGRQGLLQKRPAVPHGAHLGLRLWGGDGPVGNSGSFFPARAVPTRV